MDVGQMVGFVEGVDAGLPIGAPFAAHVAHHMHLVDFVVLDIARRQSDPLAQRRRLAVDVDENETADHIAAYFAQARAMGDQPGIEGGLIGDFFQLAVAGELPAVKGASEARHAAAVAQRNAISAVRADVVEGLDRGIFLAHQEEFFMTDFEHRVVAGFRNVRRHAGKQPDARPQQFPFLAHEVGRVNSGPGSGTSRPLSTAGCFASNESAGARRSMGHSTL
jgi:hypothetical protein